MVKLIAMDMDGTITQHKSRLCAQNRRVLLQLQERYQLVVVGAGTCGRICGQLGVDKIDLLGSYGMQEGYVKAGHLIITKDVRMPADRESIDRRVTALRRQYGYTEFQGESVEFHETGMVTIPLLGTKAKLGTKLAFDPSRRKRRLLYQEVVSIFPEYTVFIGGTSSFDMAPRPYNKLFALEQYAEAAGLSRTEIVYVGDDYGLGGNDEQIYQSDITFLPVDSYLDFPLAMKGLIPGNR